MMSSFLKTALIAVCIFCSPIILAQTEEQQAFITAFQSFQTALQTGDQDNAKLHAKTSYELGKNLYGEDNLNTAALAINYGATLTQELKLAESLVKEGLAIQEKAYGKNSMEIMPALMSLAQLELQIYGQRFSSKDGLGVYRRVIDILDSNNLIDSIDSANYHLEAGIRLLEYQDQDINKNAVDFLNKADEIFSSYSDTNSKLNSAVARLWIGTYRVSRKDYQEALKVLPKVLKTLKSNAPGSEEIITTQNLIATAHEASGNAKKATPFILASALAASNNSDNKLTEIYAPELVYPPGALNRCPVGTITINAFVDKKGFITESAIVEEETTIEIAAFLNITLDVVNKSRFIPRVIDGEIVETDDLIQTFNFNSRASSGSYCNLIR